MGGGFDDPDRALRSVLAEIAASGDDREAALISLTEQFARALGAPLALALLFDREGRRLAVKAAWIEGLGGGGALSSLEIDHAVLAGMFASGEPSFEPRPRHPQWRREGRRHHANWGLAIPLEAQPPRAGGLFAGFEEPPAGARGLLGQASGFAALATICLRHAAELERVDRLARDDPLTGCLNRATLVGVLEAEIGRAARHGHTLSICFLDLDRFKAVNDRAGHLAGDRVLAEVGRALTSSVREYDLVGRFGGDEFMIVMPETSHAEAALVGERLVGALEQVNAPPELSVGASFGIAEWRPGAPLEELLAVADREMRRAKQSVGARS